MEQMTPEAIQNERWHDVKPEDQNRIRCGAITDQRMTHCGKPATKCLHSHWRVNGKSGISFRYYCDGCFSLVRML